VNWWQVLLTHLQPPKYLSSRSCICMVCICNMWNKNTENLATKKLKSNQIGHKLDYLESNHQLNYCFHVFSSNKDGQSIREQDRNCIFPAPQEDLGKDMDNYPCTWANRVHPSWISPPWWTTKWPQAPVSKPFITFIKDFVLDQPRKPESSSAFLTSQEIIYDESCFIKRQSKT
jgi:hypothetical protein